MHPIAGKCVLAACEIFIATDTESLFYVFFCVSVLSAAG
jgi:hypothetical protein